MLNIQLSYFLFAELLLCLSFTQHSSTTGTVIRNIRLLPDKNTSLAREMHYSWILHSQHFCMNMYNLFFIFPSWIFITQIAVLAAAADNGSNNSNSKLFVNWTGFYNLVMLTHFILPGVNWEWFTNLPGLVKKKGGGMPYLTSTTRSGRDYLWA